jgi:hypothetical protein
VRPTSENAERILAALEDSGFGSLNLSKDDFTTAGMVVQLGVPPVRIDIITRVSGVSWEKADAAKVSGYYGDAPVFFMGREDFIANKKATQAEPRMPPISRLLVDSDRWGSAPNPEIYRFGPIA